MKKQGKQNEKPAKGRQDERETVNDFSQADKGQPLPQPKDYDEIEY